MVKKIFFVMFLSIFVFSLNTFVMSGEPELTPKEGFLWLTVSGKLDIVDMSAVKGVWQEFALRQDDGEVVILLGEEVEKLMDKVGQEMTVTGILKPRMRYGGKLVRVVEVRSIDSITP